MTALEIVAAIFGFLCVSFYIFRNMWSWPTGLVQVALLIVVFWNAKLYADMLLHCAYVVFQIYGWWAWWKSKDVQTADKSVVVVSVRSLSIPLLTLSLALTLSMTVVFSWALMKWTDAQSPIPDSFVAATSLVAQTLLAGRYVQNWSFWIVVNTVGIFLFAYKGLYPTCILYCLFWIMAVIGLMTWTRAYRLQLALESEP